MGQRPYRDRHGSPRRGSLAPWRKPTTSSSRLVDDSIVDQVSPFKHRVAKLLSDPSASVFVNRVAVRVAESLKGGPDALLPCQSVIHRVPSNVLHLGANLLLDLGRDDDG